MNNRIKIASLYNSIDGIMSDMIGEINKSGRNINETFFVSYFDVSEAIRKARDEMVSSLNAYFGVDGRKIQYQVHKENQAKQ